MDERGVTRQLCDHDTLELSSPCYERAWTYSLVAIFTLVLHPVMFVTGSVTSRMTRLARPLPVFQAVFQALHHFRGSYVGVLLLRNRRRLMSALSANAAGLSLQTGNL